MPRMAVLRSGEWPYGRKARGSGVRSVFFVQGVRLVRFAAVVTNGRLAPIADLDMIGAEVAGAFDALLVSLV